jgi:uncharacterized protein
VIIPDVNLLLYAMITSFPQHRCARQWWEDTVNAPTRIGLTGPTVFGFLRIATNARIFATPLAVTEAIGYVRDWLAQPNVELLKPSTSHLDIALGLLEKLGTAGDLTTDVQLAAYAIERNAQVCSNDTDFARFSGLKWSNPLHSGS